MTEPTGAKGWASTFWNRIGDYIPVIGSIKVVIDIFKAQKEKQPKSSSESLREKHSWKNIRPNQSGVDIRKFFVFIPVIGTFAAAGFDIYLKKHKQRKPSTPSARGEELKGKPSTFSARAEELKKNRVPDDLPNLKKLRDEYLSLLRDILSAHKKTPANDIATRSSLKDLYNAVYKQYYEPIQSKIIRLKKIKNEEQAHSAQLVTDSCRQGNVSGVKALIKSEQERGVRPKLIPRETPQSQQSRDMREILEEIFSPRNDLSINFDQNTRKYTVSIGNKKICEDLGSLLKQVNWSHVASPNSHWREKISEEDKKAAYDDYKGTGYSNINRFLRGNIEEAFNTPPDSRQIVDFVKKIAALVLAVSDLPDYDPNRKTHRYLWRGDDFTGPKGAEEIQRRINAIRNHQGPESYSGFLSTSHTQLDPNYSEGNCITLIRGNAGEKLVDIGGKEDKGENEVLFLPFRIEWLYHRQLDGGTHLFIARAIPQNMEVEPELPPEIT